MRFLEEIQGSRYLYLSVAVRVVCADRYRMLIGAKVGEAGYLVFLVELGRANHGETGDDAGGIDRGKRVQSIVQGGRCSSNAFHTWHE